MVPKSGSQLPDTPFSLTESLLSAQIGQALREQLGASRRATKMIMRWTGVSDKAARSWLQGQTTPSGVHLVALAARSDTVMSTLLRLTGHGDLEVGMSLRNIEAELIRLLAIIRSDAIEKPH